MRYAFDWYHPVVALLFMNAFIVIRYGIFNSQNASSAVNRSFLILNDICQKTECRNQTRIISIHLCTFHLILRNRERVVQ